MMTTASIVLWNIRGLNDPLGVHCHSETPSRGVCFTGNPPDIGDSVICEFCMGGIAYHSTHTSYYRGMSVLIYRSPDFQLFDKVVDYEGRYVFLLCRLFQVTCILAAVYVPPLFTATVLRILLSYQLSNSNIPLILVGDVNGVLDPVLDKHPSLTMGLQHTRSPLLKFTEEVGWIDPWCFRNPKQKQFSCFSKTLIPLEDRSMFMYTFDFPTYRGCAVLA